MVGSTISHYRVLEKVGSGGMGVVYKAEDLNLGRVVALKTLITESPDLRVRLLAEAQAAASLSHPNICTVYEIDREHLLLAMEFVEGETVAQKLRSGPLPIAKALDIATQASEGLHAAHQRGITHRDVKSANLMVTREGQVKVMDFGLALTDDATRITETGVVTGTPSYMAPEQAAGKTVDRRSDIWALAVVLYEMVSGRTPFSGGSPAAIVHALLHDSPAPLTSLRADVPLELDRILAKALRKDPTERYQRLDDFIVDLKSLSASVSSPPLTSRRRRRESGPTKRHVYVGTAAALVVAALVWQVSRIRAPQQQSTPAVAVLPLADLSLAAQNSYISDGLTDALITELGSVANLRVTSRTSVMRYKSTQEPISQIAAALKVDYVMEGSVLQDGQRLRLSARLIRGQQEQQVWSHAYERDSRDILSLQRELAQAVAAEIGARLTSATRDRVRDVNPQAYNAYLIGLQYWSDPAQRGAAVDQFQRAIDLDRSFAPAYAALARAYGAGAGGFNDRHLMWKRGTELANTALRLDPTLADAHNALGWLKMYFEYDWPGAAKAYRRALELNPSLADAHHGYAHYLMISGQFDEGFAAGWRALELSPFDRIYMAHDIWALFMARRFGDADRQARSILAADPGNTLARWYSARVYEQLGYFGRVLTEDLSSPAEIARAHALSGSEAEARKILSEMMRNSDTVNAPFGIALVYLSLGDKQSAVDWLERGYERRVYPLPEIARDVRFDSLRSERRFRELLVRMGLT